MSKVTASPLVLNGRVRDNYLQDENGKVQVGCKHSRGKTACGGCFARLYFAMLAIQEGANGKSTVDAVFAAMKED